MINKCDHANEVPVACLCSIGCVCRMTMMDGGTGICHSAAVASRASDAKATKEHLQFPHCDMGVLHAPGRCEYCDRHPKWQKLRVAWNVNFTGESDPNKTTCPATQRRPVASIEAWPGNRAVR